MAMSDEVVEGLEREIHEQSRRIADLAAALRTAEEDLKRLRIAQDVVRRLYDSGDGSGSDTQGGDVSPHSQTPLRVHSEAALIAPRFDGPADGGTGTTPQLRRVRSTQMVADLVKELGAASRDEVVAAFADRGLAPASWQNPRNAIGNALGRAVERGLLDHDNENDVFYWVERS